MNNNSDPQNNPRQEFEAKLTALLLGELPTEEAQALRQKIARDPNLAKIHGRLQATIQLVKQTVASPEEQAEAQPATLKLSEDRREKLLAHFKTVKPKEFAETGSRRPNWKKVYAMAAMVAIIGIIAAIVIPSLSSFKSESEVNLALGAVGGTRKAPDTMYSDGERIQSQEAIVASSGFDRSRELSQPPMGSTIQSSPPTRTPIVLPVAGEPHASELALNDSKVSLGAFPSGAAQDAFAPAPVAAEKPRENPGFGPGSSLAGAQNVDFAQKDSLFYRFPQSTSTSPVTSGNSTLSLQPATAPAQPSTPAGGGFFFAGGGGGGGIGGGAQMTATPPPASATPKSEVAAPNTIVLPAAAPEVAAAATASSDSFAAEPKVEVKTKFVDVSQADSKQLGFNWKLGDELAKNEPAAQAGIAENEKLAEQGAPKVILNGVTTSLGEKKEVLKVVPLLADVPAQGSLFRSEDKNLQNRDGGKSTLGVDGGVLTWNGVTSGVSTVTNNIAFGLTTPAAGTPLTPLVDPATGLPLASATVRSVNGAATTLVQDGRLLYEMGKPDEAESKLQEAIKQDPQNQAAYYYLNLAREMRFKTAMNRGDVASRQGLVDLENAWDNSPSAKPLLPVPNPRSSGAIGGLSGKQLADAKGAESVNVNQRYLEAKRKLEQLQRFGQILNSKITSEGTDVLLPKTSMVEIVDQAVPPAAPGAIRRAFGGKVTSTARVKLERDQSDITGLQGATGNETGYDPYFVQTESEVIQSEPLLGKVVDSLKLDESWVKKQNGRRLTKEETIALLKKNLELRTVKNTALLEITYKSTNPDEAAKVANAVAEAYHDHRVEQRKELTAGGIATLEKRFAEQQKKIAAAQTEVDRLAGELQPPKIPQPDAAPTRPSVPAPIPQPEILTRENAFSTFSLNVSDVSFKLSQASLEKGVLPEVATIRSEEFINAFDYRDPEPGPGSPMGFAWERARYPFAQNRDLLRFSVKTAAQGRQPGRPLNLVLLVDSSGSMERADRVRIIREALRVLAGQLQAQDTFSVVSFARTARLFADGVPGNQAGKVAEDVSGLTPEGGTNLEDAMNLAYQTALRHYQANGINRVVLLTDGAANLGNVEPESLKQKAEANRKQGIALDCFGIGWDGYNDDLLEVLSRNGGGRYGFINTPDEAASGFAGQLAGALQVAAADVKVQVEFNPKRVTSYRQIGYANHQLTKEQFRDNTVAAAQIGAAESGNALYVVEINPTGDGPLGTVHVRYRMPGTSDYREQEWTVSYTGTAVPFDEASPAMRLAGTASAFSECLAASPYATEVTPDRLLGYLSGVANVYGADTRPKKLEWMIRQAQSLAGSQNPGATTQKAPAKSAKSDH